jgi:hypothetical protein
MDRHCSAALAITHLSPYGWPHRPHWAIDPANARNNRLIANSIGISLDGQRRFR